MVEDKSEGPVCIIDKERHCHLHLCDSNNKISKYKIEMNFTFLARRDFGELAQKLLDGKTMCKFESRAKHIMMSRSRSRGVFALCPLGPLDDLCFHLLNGSVVSIQVRKSSLRRPWRL
jgi:hypothetical protein